MFYTPAITWALIAFTVRGLLCLALHLYSINVGLGGFAPYSNIQDDRTYWAISNQLIQGVEPNLLPNSYPVVLAFVYLVTGPNLLIGQLINAFAGALSVYFGVIIAREISNSIHLPKFALKYAVGRSGLFLSFYPTALFHSTQLLKDPLTILFGIINLYACVLILTRKKLYFWILWGISLYASYTFRPYAAVSLAACFIAYLITCWRTTLQKKLLVSVVVLLLLGLLPSFLGIGFFASDLIQPWLDSDKLSTTREGFSDGGSVTDVAVDYSNPLGFLLTFPLSWANIMFGPFPWQIRSAVQATALPETLIMWFLAFRVFVPSIRQRRQQSESQDDKLLVIFCFLLVGTIALFNDNFGTTVRLRHLPWDAFLIYSSIVFAKRLAQKKAARQALQTVEL